MTLPTGDDTDTPQVTTSRNHADVARVELDDVVDLSGGDVNLHGVVRLDQGIRVTDGAAVVEHQVRDLVGALADLLDAAQLVLNTQRIETN